MEIAMNGTSAVEVPVAPVPQTDLASFVRAVMEDNERLRSELRDTRNASYQKVREREYVIALLMQDRGWTRFETKPPLDRAGWEPGMQIEVVRADYSDEVVVTLSKPSQQGSVRFDVEVKRTDLSKAA